MGDVGALAVELCRLMRGGGVLARGACGLGGGTVGSPYSIGELVSGVEESEAPLLPFLLAGWLTTRR